MEQTIQSNRICAVIDSWGAQMLSLRLAGREYLWQGDPRYWGRRAPLLFPVIARMQEQRYLYQGKSYPVQIHGFLSHRKFSVEQKTQDSLTLVYQPDVSTWENYPFWFCYRINYHVTETNVGICVEVENLDRHSMHFAIGWHPGFRVPLEDAVCFEDYFLEWEQPGNMTRICFDGKNLVTQQREAFLPSQRRLPLRHDLFDRDAIVLAGSGCAVTLRTEHAEHGLTLEYPCMPYLALWQRPYTDAPYLCIEPWSALPGRAGTIEEPARRGDYFHLEAGGRLVRQWSVKLF